MPATTGSPAGATAIRPFTIPKVPEAELQALQTRIAGTRWPDPETVTDESQGVPLAMIQDLAGYWATGLRLAQVRGDADRLAALRDRDRRAGHPFHPRPLPARGCAAADRHARLARLDHRAVQDRRPAHRSHRPRRGRLGRVPPGDPVAAGLRVLRPAAAARLGPDPHRPRLGRADETPRLYRGSRRKAATGAGRLRT